VKPVFVYNRAALYQSDCVAWLTEQPDCSLHACVTDPPYGLVEYSPGEQAKLRSGHGGVWRIPPSFDGHTRAPLPRFTTLDAKDFSRVDEFFGKWAAALLPVLVPGAHVLMASNPIVSPTVIAAIVRAGFERRGEIVRLVMTMRGGDRPKNAHLEFDQVSVLPRSMYEPWLLFRKPLEGRVQDNLRRWKTGGLHRISSARPFGDVIKSHPTRKEERRLAPHPSLKPQAFLRQVVRAILPLGEGVIVDPFAGSGSTLAAAEAVGYESIGIESDELYIQMASTAIPKLALHTIGDWPREEQIDALAGLTKSIVL
jgi:DNA modification methylase